jgi:hypothetical protein
MPSACFLALKIFFRGEVWQGLACQTGGAAYAPLCRALNAAAKSALAGLKRHLQGPKLKRKFRRRSWLASAVFSKR